MMMDLTRTETMKIHAERLCHCSLFQNFLFGSFVLLGLPFPHWSWHCYTKFKFDSFTVNGRVGIITTGVKPNGTH